MPSLSEPNSHQHRFGTRCLSLDFSWSSLCCWVSPEYKFFISAPFEPKRVCSNHKGPSIKDVSPNFRFLGYPSFPCLLKSTSERLLLGHFLYPPPSPSGEWRNVFYGWSLSHNNHDLFFKILT